MSELVKLETRATREMLEMLVFPILKVLYFRDGTETHKLVGTGFFFSNDGLFFTAKHVVEGPGSVLDLEGADKFAVYCIHAVNLERKFVARYINVESIKLRNDTDIAAGYVEKNQMFNSSTWISKNHLKKPGV